MGVPVIYGKGKIYALGKTFKTRAAAEKAGVKGAHMNAAGVPKGKSPSSSKSSSKKKGRRS